jgi:hypothetical protein
VGDGTSGTDDYLMPDLQTVKQPWSVANNMSIYSGPKSGFDYFSAVCWFFGREAADGLNNTVPIGLSKFIIYSRYIVCIIRYPFVSSQKRLAWKIHSIFKLGWNAH